MVRSKFRHKKRLQMIEFFNKKLVLKQISYLLAKSWQCTFKNLLLKYFYKV